MGTAPWNMDWYRLSHIYKGMEIGVSKGFLTPIFESYYYVEEDGVFKEKKAITRGKVKNHWGFYYGYAFRITKFEENKALGLNVSFMYNVVEMSTGDKAVPVGQGYNIPDALYSYAALPISVDYKVGGEAAWDKFEKSMFAIGAGVCPKFTTTGLEGEATPTIAPFLKAEFGYFAGIALKLRGTYFIGEQKFEGGSVSGSAFGSGVNFGIYNPTVSITSGGEFVITLIAMPFSRAWD